MSCTCYYIILLSCLISQFSLPNDFSFQNNNSTKQKDIEIKSSSKMSKEMQGAFEKELLREQSIADKCIEDQLNFLDFLISGEIIRLLQHIDHPNLSIAETAFHILKDLWPWKREYTFLISNLANNNEESDYIANLGVDIMKIVERDLITRQDYIAKYTNPQSFKIIHNYKEQCILLQKEGDLNGLSDEISHLYNRVVKNGKKNKSIDNIRLAIVEKVYLDPVTTFLHTIKYAPSLEEAHNALINLETYLLNEAKEKNVI